MRKNKVVSHEKNTDDIRFQSKKRKVKARRKLKKWVLVVIMIILILIIGFNLFILFEWNKENKKTAKTINEISNIDIRESEDDNAENVNEPTDQNSDYWYYVNFPLINVDFNELIKKNPDTVAWLNVNNTNINYPVVQTTDNDYYLNHSYDRSTNKAGWVFLDFRNNSDLSNRNNIIYAHSRSDKTMFGSLKDTLKKSWYTDKSNHIIRVSTPKEDTLWQIFSVYVIKKETYYITTDFNGDDEYETFLNTIRERSKYNFKTEINASDCILTLSTCYSNTQRTVVHAKLIKKSKK